MSKLQGWLIIGLLIGILGSVIYFGINDPVNRSVLTKSSVREANQEKYEQCYDEVMAQQYSMTVTQSFLDDCGKKYPFLD